MTEEQWMTIPEAADLYTVSTKTIRRWIAAGELEAKRFGPRLIRIKRQSVANLGRDLAESGALMGHMDDDGRFTPACYAGGATGETRCVQRPRHGGPHLGYVIDGPNSGDRIEW